MYLKKTPNTHGRIRLSIVDNYYDKVKKCSRQKTVASIGWLDELEKQYDDPIAYFTKRVAQLNEEKQKKQAPINFTFYNSDRLCVGDNLRKNLGYTALCQIYHELGIHTFLTNRQRHSKEQYDSNTIMKMLVYSRLLFPVSKKSSYDNRERFFENTDYSLDDIYRCLSFLDKHRENLQVWMNDRIKKNYGRDTSLIYYDVTNYYFETDEPNDFLRKGVCKEYRPNPIVQMGLFIDNKGIPITYELFPGNTNDCLTYRPNLGRIKKQFDLGRVITVADKEMTTGDIRSILPLMMDMFSVCPSGELKKASKTMSSKKMSMNGSARNINENPGNYTRATSYGAAKYVKKIDYDKETGEILTSSSILNLDEENIREEKALDGYYMLLTNEMEASDDEIIDMYRGLWRIEESFKVTKSELEARPVYVWTKEHIEAHFLTCFVALTIARILENKLEHKYSVGTILESLSKAECSLVQQNYYLFDYYDELLKDIGLILENVFGL